MNTSPVTMATKSYLRGMWTNWLIICAALMLPIILAPLIKRQWVPIVRISELFILIAYLQSNITRRRPLYMRSIYVLISILIIATTITLTFNFMHLRWIFGDKINTYSHFFRDFLDHLPYLNTIVLAPVMTIVAGLNLLSGKRSTFLQECRARYAYATDDGFVGGFMRQEARLQVRTIFCIGAFLWVVEWAYYYFFFINININTPDVFMFVIFPCSLFGLTIIFLIQRYSSFWAHYKALCDINGNCDENTELRFMIISDGDMLLTDAEEALIKGELIDTPAIVRLRNTSSVSDENALKRFETLTGITDCDLHFIYRSTALNAPTPVQHYVVVLPSTQLPENCPIKGEWYNAMQIEGLIHDQIVSPQLAAAIRRIYTVAMAWKTYDENGNRLYTIKNYRPTFRLKDFSDWNVNYDDPLWLNIASNNEDSRMFRLRRIWRSYVRGIGC